MIKFKGVDIFTIEELNNNAKLAKAKAVINSILEIRKEQITEWDGSKSDVVVYVRADDVLVKYEDGTVYREDRKRFEAGKWAESLFTENLIKAFKEYEKTHSQNKPIEKEPVIIKCILIPQEHDIMIKAKLDNGTIDDIMSFYPDEIDISPLELVGKTVKEALDIKYEKDRRYLRL